MDSQVGPRDTAELRAAAAGAEGAMSEGGQVKRWAVRQKVTHTMSGSGEQDQCHRIAHAMSDGGRSTYTAVPKNVSTPKFAGIGHPEEDCSPGQRTECRTH